MKKISLISIALSALLLTSCHEYHEGDITGVPSETTSLTLTEEIIPEKTPDSSEPLREIELAVFDPFANAVKVDNTVKNDLLEFAENMETARQILYADWKIYDSDDYTDLENIVEQAEWDFEYKPFINTEIAQNEEELFGYLRGFFTENYQSDEELRAWLFENYYSTPSRYRTIDGQLCIRSGYDGVMTNIICDDIWVMSYNENYAEVVMEAHDVEYPPDHAFIGLEKSEQYGWRVDSLEFKAYDETFIGIYITGFMEKYDTLNKIFGGGNVPENGSEITENGIKYVQTDLDMSVEEMREFFTDTFRPMTVTVDGSRSKLLVPYTEKYIDSVYLEKDGVLYRAADAPKWYLPKNVFDPYNSGFTSAHFGNARGDYGIIENFYDDITGESFSQNIVVSYDYSWTDDEKEGIIYKYHGIYIASELPIRELGGDEMNIKPVKLSGKAEDITDEQLKELYGYAYKTVYGKEFLKDGSGNFLTKEGKNLDEYREEFGQTFTDRYTEKYFKLEKGGTYFRGDSQFLELFVLREENSVDDISVFGGYSGIYVGFGAKGSDLSVRDNELTVTSRSGDKIVLTMTVWHVDPENELKVGEDYAYRLENGNLVIAGKFGGWDDNGEQIVIADELSGTIAEVPVGSDKSEFYGKHYDNYLVKYDYDLVLDDGVWKFDNFYIWD